MFGSLMRSVRPAEEADLLRRRAVGVAHEGRQRRHLLGVERLGLGAAHRAELHGALAAGLQQRARGASARRRGCARRAGRWPRATGRCRAGGGRSPGAGRRASCAWSAMAGVWKTWKITWLERWPWVSVSSARRSSTARIAGRTPFRRGATSAWASLRCEAPAAPARQLAERAVVVEPRVDLGAVAVDELVQARLVVGQPGAHDPLVAGQPVQARAVGRVGVGGLRGGGHDQQGGVRARSSRRCRMPSVTAPRRAPPRPP